MLKCFQATGQEFRSDDETDAYMIGQMVRFFLFNYKSLKFDTGIMEGKEIDFVIVGKKQELRIMKLNSKQFEPILLDVENAENIKRLNKLMKYV